MEVEEQLLLMPACEEIVRHLHYRQPKMPMSMCDVRVECRFKGRLLEGAQRKTIHVMKLPELWATFVQCRQYCKANVGQLLLVGYFRPVSGIL